MGSSASIQKSTDDGGVQAVGLTPPMSYRNPKLIPTVPRVDCILGGAKPADLPVQAPVKFELAINLKIAKSLGFVSLFLERRADAVIE